jgi:hypothetical protein
LQIAHVGHSEDPASKQRVLRIMKAKQGDEKVIRELLFNSPIAAIKMNHHRAVVVEASKLTIIDTHTMDPIHIIDETPLNPLGIVALTADDSSVHNVVAFPGSSTSGDVNLFNVISLVRAHRAIIATTSR